MLQPLDRKRGQSWSEDGLIAAMKAVQRSRLTQRAAASRYNIPRRTLRDHLKTGEAVKRLGRKPVLSSSQEDDLCSRIKRFAKIGVPLTPKFIRRQAFLFCERYDIKHNFNLSKRIAGTDWLRQFLKRNPSITKRKPQIMNPARAQKLNKSIVHQHFEAIKTLYNELDILNHPERLYNMDEKGCRITVHNQKTVLAEKGIKRLHLVAPEHAENVTIAMCVNAIGSTIPPMILFKGQRHRPDLNENLPAGALVRMAPKGSMTTDLFVEFIQHLAKHKVHGKCLLIFDGAKCHLSSDALDEADKNDIILYCLPSNTTHELQPLDKTVNKSYEHYWDEAVLNYLYTSADRTLTKTSFNKLFSRVWPKCMTHNNIVNGFKATGLFPFDPEIIPEEAFAPSILSEIPWPHNREKSTQDSTTDASDNGAENIQSSKTLQTGPEINCLQVTSFVHEHNVGKQRRTDINSGSTANLLENRPRLVAYSSSTDISDLDDNELQKSSLYTMKEADRVSPSIIFESNLRISGEGVVTQIHNDENLVLPSCSGLHRRIRKYSNSDTDTSVSDLDMTIIHENRKYLSSNIYSYSSSDEENVSQPNNKGEVTPEKKKNSQSNFNKITSNPDNANFSKEDNISLVNLKQNEKTPFQKFLPTPNYAITKSKHPRKKALNYKGQRITTDLFKERDKINVKQKKPMKLATKKNQQQKRNTTNHKAKKGNDKLNKKIKGNNTKQRKIRTDSDEEEWYCHACFENKKIDMRQCVKCFKWYHEECVGLSKTDKEFACC